MTKISVFVSSIPRALTLLLMMVHACASDDSIRRREWDVTKGPGFAWEVRAEQSSNWIWLDTTQAAFPKSNEAILAADGVSFDGVAVYRLRVSPRDALLSDLERGRWRLRFDAVATEAQVSWIDDQTPVLLGSHLGGWTPFAVDITDVVRQVRSEDWLFEIRVDEKVGHDTQGFLPIVAPHFGGIWQGVALEHLPESSLQQESLEVVPIGRMSAPQFRVRVEGASLTADSLIRAELRPWGSPVDSTPLAVTECVVSQSDGTFRAEGLLESSKIEPWSPSMPQRYEVRVVLLDRKSGHAIDSVARSTGWRTIETRGRQLLLNSKPIQVRGILNWGYDPSRLGPTTDETQMRAELELCRSWGFNLMKFCLWLPPRRYLELADEYGVLVWMEYPTWHPRMDESTRLSLLREYGEFYRFDGAHPSIVLRSLTCETGHGADQSVLQSLYDLAKDRIPGAIVEDDSSWIEWHRIHDFYDDHPYGNNHTWPSTLERLERHIADRTPMPLMLGEAIAADTWLEPQSLGVTEPPREIDPASNEKIVEPRVLRHPGFVRANVAFERDVAVRYGAEAAQRLKSDSMRYGLLMRKYQIETYRRMQPHSGYVVSVIRDFPLAGMGLIDFADQPKWSAANWSFQGDTMLLLETPSDARSFETPARGDQASEIAIRIHLSHAGAQALPSGILKVSLANQVIATHRVDSLEPASTEILDLNVPIEGVAEPTQKTLTAEYFLEGRNDSRAIACNAWDLWFLPPVNLRAHLEKHESWNLEIPLPESSEEAPGVLICRRLDRDVLARLEQGARVILVPDGEPGSFALHSHWFLRGAPVIASRTAELGIPREFWIDLQHFDLAGDVVPDWQELDAIEPLVSLWDNHDITSVKTHPLLFQMPVGAGQLMVSAFRHDGPGAAGEWLFAKLVSWAMERPHPNAAASRVATGNLERLRQELFQREVRLDEVPWKFRPDADALGFDSGWSSQDWDDQSWDSLRIDAHWDGQGHPNLDGWAWYRRQVTIPEDWSSPTTYLSFTGVDDHYRAFINGVEVGQGGVVETRQTAFEERASHEISRLVKPGQTVTIAIAVYDWYGAGGIFRPVSLTATPIRAARPWLR